jgi:hypothetical protein
VNPDHDLMVRWFASLKLVPPYRGFGFCRRGDVRWSVVARTFCVGSTRAKEACLRHGYDPDELVRLPK